MLIEKTRVTVKGEKGFINRHVIVSGEVWYEVIRIGSGKKSWEHESEVTEIADI